VLGADEHRQQQGAQNQEPKPHVHPPSPPKTELKSALDDVVETTTQSGPGQEENREAASGRGLSPSGATRRRRCRSSRRHCPPGGRAFVPTGRGGVGGHALGARAGGCGRNRCARPTAATIVLVVAATASPKVRPASAVATNISGFFILGRFPRRSN